MFAKRPLNRRAIALAAAFALANLIGSFGGAWAHTDLERSNPPAGRTVRTAPKEVSLWFTESLEPAFSSVEVTNSDGERVDQGGTEVSGSTMRIGLKALPPGSYRVHWRAISSDTHKVEGNFTFKVSGD
jgi:methionine-rich copper-binding protein CopC